MSRMQPELWVERANAAVSFYERAFGAATLHRVGDGDDIVAQLAVGEARFWVASADSTIGRFSPEAIGASAFECLLKRLRGDTAAPQALDFPAQLIVRGSTQRPHS